MQRDHDPTLFAELERGAGMTSFTQLEEDRPSPSPMQGIAAAFGLFAAAVGIAGICAIVITVFKAFV